MIDKNQNENEGQNQDEYQFADLDNMEPGLGDMDNDPSLSVDSETTEPWYVKKENLRYALIAVGLIIGIVVVYQFMSSMFTSRSTQVKTTVPAPVIQPATSPISTQPTQVIQALPSPSEGLSKKVSALEVSQGSLSSDVSNLNNQVSALSTQVNDVNNKIDQLTQAMNALAAQVSEQSQQLTVLSARTKPVVKRVARPRPVSAPIYYYIQAVIPGRAWLVSANGATMTVREGSSIPGYGVVKLIDPAQGRLVTSSGRIIAFSQQDT